MSLRNVPITPKNALTPHRLCFLYFTLSVVGDGEIMETEIDSITQCIDNWDFSELKKSPKQIANESLEWWKQTPLRERAQLCMGLFKSISEENVLANKEHVLNDLIDIAKSDGVYTDTEKLFIQEVANDLGLKDKIIFDPFS